MNKYWVQRQQEELYNRISKQAEKKLYQNYLHLYKDTKAQLMAMYAQLKTDDVLNSDLYRFNGYYDFLNFLKEKLIAQGHEELGIIEPTLANMYKANSANICRLMSFSILPIDSQVERVINRVWCADGQNWSDRVWNNKNFLAKRIEQGIVDCFARGDSKDKIIKQLERDFGVGYNNAARIVRTELNYVQNQAALDRYSENGIEFIEVLSNQADDYCIDKNKKIVPITECQVGVTIPPFHPNCRCSIIPVQKE